MRCNRVSSSSRWSWRWASASSATHSVAVRNATRCPARQARMPIAIARCDFFPSARHLCAWAGLTPTVRSSDAKARLGHISRLGSGALRWALVEAAQKNTQGDGPLAETFQRIAERRGRQIAKVAVARKILTLCFYGLRDGEIRCHKAPDRASAVKVMAA